jgi:HEAT repeat protein
MRKGRRNMEENTRFAREIERQVNQFRDSDERVRCQAAQTLAALGQRAVAALIPYLQAEDVRVQYGVATALGQMGEKALPALTQALALNHASVRRGAAWAIGKIGPLRVGDWPPRSREHPALSALMTAVTDPDASVRQEAAVTLGILRDAQAISALIGALSDAEEQVRVQAARALAQMNGGSGVARQVLANRGLSAEARYAALEVIRQYQEGILPPVYMPNYPLCEIGFFCEQVIREPDESCLPGLREGAKELLEWLKTQSVR